MLQYLHDVLLTGSSSKWVSPAAAAAAAGSGRFYLATALPLLRPVQRSSNPFCCLSPNKTGFVYFNKNPNCFKGGPQGGPQGLQTLPRLSKTRRPFPRPHGRAQIGGTDPTPPVFPKGV
ncbi:hypothetical protein, conserved [Eimeria tenella]|uniref:Uncharacterized protein n=1 Tax=Eimeria tenella TaxID=5802 RepID=U6L383_EIMTE|nr:hypothetical protein, conserved [Eimeria tenella]CDJ44621.1 hypothetical protein, conserved [Eimeria tenella]|eukprot:XP_013235369.1 hypothetical protein, conserved [Eimeria tenella]